MPAVKITEKRGELVQMNVWLPSDLKRQLKVAAAQAEKTMQEVIAEAVEQYMSRSR